MIAVDRDFVPCVDCSTETTETRRHAVAGMDAMRRDLLLQAYGWLLLLFTLLLPVAIIRDLSTQPWTLWLHAGAYIALAAGWSQRRQLGTVVIGSLVLGTFYVIGTVGLLRTGIAGIHGLAYGLLMIATPLAFGRRIGLVATIVCCMTYVVIGVLSVTGVLVVNAPDTTRYLASSANWVHTGAGFLGFAILAAVISGAAHRKLRELLQSEAERGRMLACANERLREMNVELEKRIGERTRRLEEANRELESFSYTVSHDLRSPLQVIEGFSSLALQESGANTPLKVRDYLQRIQSGARRMHDMIGHLLRVSQLGCRVVQCEQVNLSQRAERILIDLRVTEPGRRVDAQVQPDMLDTADPELIDNVLHNLLGNAWKFSARTEQARIEITRDERDGRFVYCVRDNGIGFDACAAQRLFQPFVRLHDKREFPGTGVGLTAVKRIIDRHGGRIWVESLPGEGASFYFTLGA